MQLRRFARVVALGLIVNTWSLALPAPGQESKAKKEGEAPRDALAALLGHEIIGTRRSLAETSDHAEARITVMPRLTNLADWEAYAARTRRAFFDRVLFRGAAAGWRDAKTRVEWLDDVSGTNGYRLRKLRYEAVPGLWVPALSYEPTDLIRRGRVPVVLNVNGHEAKGKAADYEQARSIDLARKGVISIHPEWFGMGQFRAPDNRHDQINQIDLCGASGVSLHYLAMTRAIDVLLAHEHADPTRVAVTGLSGGGWQTIFLSAFETRSRKFSDLGDSEQTPTDMAAVTDYAVMTALMAPRPLLLTYNEKDNCCFASGHALPPLLEAAAPVYALHGKPFNLRSHVNKDPGTHNYLLDNRQAFYRMLGDHFFAGQAGFDPAELAVESEIRPVEDLDVELPKGNASLHSLALGLSKSLPRDPALPRAEEKARVWQTDRRAKLRELVRAGSHEASVVSERTEEVDGINARSYHLKVSSWSVPVVELSPKRNEKPGTTTLVLADKGRSDAETVALAREHLSKGERVLLLDPFYVGEAKLAERAYLFALLIASVGDRPLGVQAGQIAAVARWAVAQGAAPVAVVAQGPRTSVMALVAAGLEPKAVGSLELRDCRGSLKELLEQDVAYADCPELYCFGLLEWFDIPQLAALSAPRKVTFVSPSPRVRQEVAGLKDWYATWNVDHDPISAR